MTDMTIGKVADVVGVGVETIRFYERRKLIEQPPRPREGGYRIYSDATVRRLHFIRRAQELGFSLREIAELRDQVKREQEESRDPNRNRSQKREASRVASQSAKRMPRGDAARLSICARTPLSLPQPGRVSTTLPLAG